MNQISLQFFKKSQQFFLEYTASYIANNESCRYQLLYKRNHSLRVSGLAGLIAKRLHMSEKEILFARLIGLYHDIARFDQYTKFNTFRDGDSFDHGDYGSELLKALPLFAELGEETRAVLECSVRFHNKREVPATLDGDFLLGTKLARDADKLDIFYVTKRGLRDGTNHLISIARSENQEVTPEVVAALALKKPIDYRIVKTELDFLLVKVGWVYDLNFVPSLALLRKGKSLQAIMDVLPQTPEVQEQLRGVDMYMDESLLHEKLAA